MSIFVRPVNCGQCVYNEAPHRRVEPIAPSNPTQNQERGHVSEYPNRDKVRHIQAAAAEAEMCRRAKELEREATQKGLQVDINV